jgi:hypothetical protein
MKTIDLSANGKNAGKYQAIVDPEYFDLINSVKWQVEFKGGGKVYAMRKVMINGKSHNVYMHRLVASLSNVGVPETCLVDHINGEGLYNVKSNLRICDHKQNIYNQKKQDGRSSKFKGVCWDKQTSKWRCLIKINGRMKSLGRFVNEEDAAKAYDAKAKELFGEFAKLNYPEVING